MSVYAYDLLHGGEQLGRNHAEPKEKLVTGAVGIEARSGRGRTT
jgi:hypothetical protein